MDVVIIICFVGLCFLIYFLASYDSKVKRNLANPKKTVMLKGEKHYWSEGPTFGLILWRSADDGYMLEISKTRDGWVVYIASHPRPKCSWSKPFPELDDAINWSILQYEELPPIPPKDDGVAEIREWLRRE